MHIKGNKNNMVNYRKKQKEGKMIPSLAIFYFFIFKYFNLI